MRFLVSRVLAGGIAGIVASVTITETLGSVHDLVAHTDGGLLAFGVLTFQLSATFSTLAACAGAPFSEADR